MGKRALRGLAILCAAIGLTLARPAGAQSEPSLNKTQMGEAMHTYFRGEKQQAPFFIGAGLAGMGAGTVMVLKGGDITRGAGFPMIGFGLIHAIVGGAFLLGTDKRVATLDAALAKDPAAWKRDEIKRMAGVNTTLVALMIVESALIVGGTTTAVVGARSECCRMLQGVGLGLAAEGAVTLLLDIFESARARDYADALQRSDPSLGASPSKGGTASMSFGPLSFSGRF